MSCISSAVRAAVEGFTDSGVAIKRDVQVESISIIIAFIISVLILSFIGKLLWNNVITELFSIAKPAKSVLQILGLMIFINLIRP